MFRVIRITTFIILLVYDCSFFFFICSTPQARLQNIRWANVLGLKAMDTIGNIVKDHLFSLCVQIANL